MSAATGYVPEEKLGTYQGVDFVVHSLTEVGGGEDGHWRFDDSEWMPLSASESAATWRALVENQNLEIVVFAYDCRYRAREIFHCLSTGFDPRAGG